ncbi:hypothetical protein BDP27DRAFT_1423619 [Rhodocollybia butyracea]|uniref:DUF4246 domain-containing protein n=1 Tax=Rhodocollybia butyracea TaxID=206335 RepID=A0A9P5PRC5_9AGAR|nr:hypothetical protein BDP27DRAFT_1423619 [Rhodocollybia butyracea]
MSQNKVPKSLNLNPSLQDLAQFCSAVREKFNWQSKIFDDKIALKWVIEAGTATPNMQVLEGRALEAVSDLRRSALAVKMLDCDILLDASGTGADNSLEHFDVGAVDCELNKSLKYARGSTYAIREPDLEENGLGILVSDNLVPQALHQELMRQLDTIAAQEPRDFHPGSFGKLPPVGTNNQFDTWLYAHYESTYPQNMVSSYAWIPSVFSMSPDGKDAHIDSYINGLGTRKQYPGLFRVIEKLFLLSLAHFEKTLKDSANYQPKDSPSVRRWRERRDGKLTRQEWTQFHHEYSSERDNQEYNEKQARAKVQLEQDIRQEECTKEKFYDLGDEFAASEMYRGKDMKVTVKVCLPPKSVPKYEGSWHMEGMPHERTVASVIYYYDTDGPLQDEGLSFRKFRDFPHDGYTHRDFRFYFSDATNSRDFELDYPSDWEVEIRDGKLVPIPTHAIPAFTELGAVPTTNICPGSNGTGRMLSFPDWLQFCFFLVDDMVQDRSEIHFPGIEVEGLENMNVLTTSKVPMQMRKCNEPTMFAPISAISADLTGRALPPEMFSIIWGYASEGTLSRGEAEVHRMRLMNDRKVLHRTARDYYTLCEH